MNNATTQDDKRKHLEFIQGVINRLSSNTFLFKGWSITIIGAIFTAMLTTNNYDLLWLILGVVLMFWSIDAYYLMLEQCYRKLYNQVSKTDADCIDYKMDISNYVSFSAWFMALKRPVLLMFYGVVLLITALVIFGNFFDINLIIKVKE